MAVTVMALVEPTGTRPPSVSPLRVMSGGPVAGHHRVDAGDLGHAALAELVQGDGNHVHDLVRAGQGEVGLENVWRRRRRRRVAWVDRWERTWVLLSPGTKVVTSVPLA